MGAPGGSLWGLPVGGRLERCVSVCVCEGLCLSESQEGGERRGVTYSIKSSAQSETT